MFFDASLPRGALPLSRDETPACWDEQRLDAASDVDACELESELQLSLRRDSFCLVVLGYYIGVRGGRSA